MKTSTKIIAATAVVAVVGGVALAGATQAGHRMYGMERHHMMGPGMGITVAAWRLCASSRWRTRTTTAS